MFIAIYVFQQLKRYLGKPGKYYHDAFTSIEVYCIHAV